MATSPELNSNPSSKKPASPISVSADRSAGRRRGIATLTGRRPQLIVVLVGLLALGIIWLGLALHLRLREQVVADTARRDVANLAVALEEQVQRTFNGVDQLLQLAKTEYEDDPAAFDVVRWVKRVPFLNELALQVAIADANGEIRGTSLAGGEIPRASVADREHFRVHRDRDDVGLFISRPVLGRISGRWSIQLTRRLNGPNGAFAGVLVVSVDPSYLSRKFASINVGNRGSVTLLGLDGYLRARSPELPDIYARNLRETADGAALLEELSRQEVTTVTEKSPVDGIERISGRRLIPNLPLVVSVGLSVQEILRPIASERRRALVLGGAVTVVLTAFLLILLRELETRRRGQDELAQANRALVDGEARYRLLADNTTDIIARIGLDGTVLYLSPSSAAVIGFTPEEVVGRKALELIHPDDRAPVARHFKRMLDAGPNAPRFSITYRAEHKDGSWTWLEVNPTLLADERTGRPIEFVDVIRNITVRKEIEAELRDKTALLEATLENMDQGLVMIDADGIVAVSNRRAVELMDLPGELLASKPHFSEVRRRKVAEGEYAGSDSGFQQWLAAGELVPPQHTYERIRPNGTAIEVRTVPLPGGGVVRTYSDVTYRRKAEQALKLSEARYRLLAENSSDIIMLRTLGGERTYVSPACETVLGYSPEEFMVMGREDLIHPEDLPNVLAIYQELGPGRPPVTDIHRLRHKDGRWISVEAVFRLTEDEGLPTVLVAIRDVSDRQRQAAELRASKERAEILLAQAQQASQAKSDFLASMSHEIRTPLNSILGFTDLLLDGYDLVPEVRRLLQQIQGSGNALLTVVDDILDFSKIEAGQVELDPKPTHIVALVDNVISIIRGVATKKKLDLRVRVDPRIPRTVIADSDRLQQVLLNLVNNAVKFTAQGHIALTVTHQGSGPKGERLRFEVADTGIGIPATKQSRLFERFSQVDSSIRRHFGGTGLGLAICKRLVELMGGAFTVDSEEGRGSTFAFTVTLPAGAEDGSPAATVPAEVVPPSKAARILLVEDLDLNQELARSVLERAGHAVDVAADGAEAVQRVQSSAYDLVLMDIQMPVMDGITATERIRNLPGETRSIPIIAMTANVLPAQVSRFKIAGMNDHVGKPFKRDELLCTVQRWLGRSTAGQAKPSAAGGFDSSTYNEVIAMIDEKRRPALLDKMAAILDGWPDRGEAEAMPREQLAGKAHQLISAAGLLGFRELSDLCRELETTCRIAAPDAALLADVDAARRHALGQITTLRQAG